MALGFFFFFFFFTFKAFHLTGAYLDGRGDSFVLKAQPAVPRSLTEPPGQGLLRGLPAHTGQVERQPTQVALLLPGVSVCLEAQQTAAGALSPWLQMCS